MRLSAVPLAAGAMVLVAAPSSPQAATSAQASIRFAWSQLRVTIGDCTRTQSQKFKRVDGRWLVDVATANTATLGCLR